MRYMVIEHFKDGKAGAIYRRFADKGRMAPEGLHYIDSWVSADLRMCFQLMDTADYSLFAQWTGQWKDLVDFEIIPIIPSAEARIKALASS
jgi:Protein of unknown function (DUF3303)